MVRAFALFGLAEVALASEDQCAFDARENICFGGTTISKQTVSGVDECCSACHATAECTHFTYTESSSSCGLKKGDPVSSSHTHCTSGVLSGPTPPSPAPVPTPPTPTPSPGPTPGPDTGGVKYKLGDRCLSIGEKAQHSHGDNAFDVILTDCDSAVEWTEGFSSKKSHANHPVIFTNWKPAPDGKVCLLIDHQGTVGVDRCEDERDGNERVSLRTYFHPSYDALSSVFKNPDYCLDADGDQLVSKLCSETGKWKREGLPGPGPYLPRVPLEPGPMLGSYSMVWPVDGGLAGINDKGYPYWWGNNQAEACPPDRRVAGGAQCAWPEKTSVPLFHGDHTPSGPYEMTRSQIVQRALVWVAHNFAGGDNIDARNNAVGVEGCHEGEAQDVCPQWYHGGACCSMPAQAWNVSYCLKHAGGLGERIDCKDMRPGDAMSFGGSHVALFAKWTDESEKVRFHIYERKGPARETQRGITSGLECFRRKYLKEDVEPDNVPLALPRQPGDDLEVQSLENPEPLDYNGECDHLDPVDYYCDARMAAMAEDVGIFV